MEPTSESTLAEKEALCRASIALLFRAPSHRGDDAAIPIRNGYMRTGSLRLISINGVGIDDQRPI